MAAQAQIRERAHPGPTTYVAVAAVLAIVTMMEVWAYYQQALRGILVPVLLVLSATKFGLVVLFFMHLKFDSRLFSVMFFGGLALAGAVLIALISLFQNFYLP
ncbi:MAG: cytochrome C oxidase subunit IV family protein [Chloroflexi bacterium]|nr:cytochrome C oxidase subunit IV family protein [Chloroflexota bacterium]